MARRAYVSKCAGWLRPKDAAEPCECPSWVKNRSTRPFGHVRYDPDCRREPAGSPRPREARQCDGVMIKEQDSRRAERAPRAKLGRFAADYGLNSDIARGPKISGH
jgi:hypothetical protein